MAIVFMAREGREQIREIDPFGPGRGQPVHLEVD